MSTYKEIKGFKVQTLSSDPVASGLAGASWSSGGSLNVGKYWNGRSGAGTQTAGLIAGGHNGSGQVGTTESYNGSSWTEVNDLNTARNSATMGGAQTSALITGGGTAEAITESWNGSSWTEVNDLNTGRRQLAMATGNANTSALAFGGYAPPTPGPVGYTGLTESWNGSSWTEVSDLNTPRSSLASTDGSATAALAIAGYRGPPTADRTKFVEQWDGSSWTEVGDVNQERMDLASCGTTTNALAFGGIDTASLAVTENYNGTSWTELADLSTARYALGGTGSTPAALAIGGYITTVQSVTEEWNIATDFIKINLGQVYFNSGSNAFKVTEQPVPGGSWSSGGSLNTARAAAGASSGSDGNTSLFIISGASPNTVNVEEYDGSAFTEIANVNNAGENGMSSGNGSTVATIFTGGNPPRAALTESWNGSSWTEVNDLNTGRGQAAGIGTQTAALVAGQAYGAIVESWDGTSWTEVNDLNTGRGNLAGMGSQTLAITAGGRSPSSPAIMGNVETWNGSSWTETTDLNTARAETSGSGVPYNNVIVIGGEPSKANTEFWNGSTWTEVGDMATAGSRISQNMGASANATLAFLQASPSVTTEEWNTPEANTTITVS